MPKPYNPLSHPLNGVFSAPSHIAVLRALKDSREGMSGRAVARTAGVNHQACAVALRNMEALGVIQRQGSGRTQLLRLNVDNALVKNLILPLLREERAMGAHIRREIAGKFESLALSATLFGSVARGEPRPGSDIDLLSVVPAGTKERAGEEARRYSADFTKKYGVRLSPIVMTVKEARVRYGRSDPLLKVITSEGVDLLSRKLVEVVS